MNKKLANDKLNVVRFHPRDPSVLAIGTDQVTQIWDIIKEEILVNLKHPCVSLGILFYFLFLFIYFLFYLSL